MKKLYTLLTLVLFSATVFAQRSTPIGIMAPISNFNLHFSNDRTITTDTIGPSSWYTVAAGGLGCQITNYVLDTGVGFRGGYVCGTNKYGDKEKAMFFDPANYWGGAISGTWTVTDVLLIFARTGLENVANGNSTVKIYGGDNIVGPTEPASATSANVATLSIDTSGNFTDYTFATPPYVTSFFASLVMPPMDTIGLYSSVAGCVEAAGNAWEKWSTNAWQPFNLAAASGGWAIDIDMAIFPVLAVNDNVGVLNSSDINIHPAFPNPANNEVTIHFALRNDNNVTINVYDMTGRLVRTLNEGNMKVGIYNKSIDVTNLSNGVYTFNVIAGASQVTSKFSVTK